MNSDGVNHGSITPPFPDAPTVSGGDIPAIYAARPSHDALNVATATLLPDMIDTARNCNASTTSAHATTCTVATVADDIKQAIPNARSSRNDMIWRP